MGKKATPTKKAAPAKKSAPAKKASPAKKSGGGRKFVSGRKKRASCVRCSRRSRTATLIVEVVDADSGDPVEDVRVDVSQSGSRIRRDTSDAGGIARFNDIEPGVKRILVNRDGDDLGRTSRYCAPGETTNALFRIATTGPGSPNRLQRIGLLDGGPGLESGGNVPQYVNLPAESKWVDGRSIRNRNRLSREVEFKVRFRYEGSEDFRWRVVDGRSDNTTYSDDEKRHDPYHPDPDDWEDETTDADGTKTLSCEVPVCGGNAYRIEARDAHGNTCRSGLIHVRRRIWVQPVAMPRGGRVTSTSTSSFRSDFRGEKIYVHERDVARMDLIENIGDSWGDVRDFKRKAREGYENSGADHYEPYIVCLAFAEHMAVQDRNVRFRRTGVSVGPGQSTVRISLVDGAGKQRYLWRNLVTGEDWFVSAGFRPDGRLGSTDISRSLCTPVGASWSRGACEAVDIDVSGLAGSVTTGRIDLRVNVVNRMRGGVAYTPGNLICIARKSWWRNASTADQNETIGHEMGHKIYMVPDGRNSDLDRLPNQYDRSGHVGSHCHTGVPAADDYSSASGDCLMFGSSRRTTSDFCSDCQAAARKVDIGDGWRRF